jgi:hypothetical protein
MDGGVGQRREHVVRTCQVKLLHAGKHQKTDL